MRSGSVVFLLGPPGAGKTALGRAASEELGLRFLDLDLDAEAARARGLEPAIAGRDVVALDWQLQLDPPVLRLARRIGTLVALWAHPDVLRARARIPIEFTPRGGLVTRGGLGPRGTSCLEFRRIDRACDLVFHLDELPLTRAVAKLVDLLEVLRAKADPDARFETLRRWFEDVLRADAPGSASNAVRALADAMARYMLSREQAGASPRALAALRSHLQAAGILVLMYDGSRGARVLDKFRSAAPYTYEFARKFTDSPPLVTRYARSLAGFARFLAEA